MSALEESCDRLGRHISHEWGIEYGDMGVAWRRCPGRWEHTAPCDGSGCTCGLDPEPTEREPVDGS